MAVAKSDAEFKDHLINCCDVDPVTQCWNWKLRRMWDGYGKVVHRGKTHRAHRMSYKIFVGEIPAGMYVLHKCDNTGCINPDHLFTGTASDNAIDMVNKGRQVGQSKLEPFMMDYIKDSQSLPVAQIADLFGVSTSTIRRIRKQRL